MPFSCLVPLNDIMQPINDSKFASLHPDLNRTKFPTPNEKGEQIGCIQQIHTHTLFSIPNRDNFHSPSSHEFRRPHIPANHSNNHIADCLFSKASCTAFRTSKNLS
mmetsp:Transcript_17660/g.35682  ORF Transcript_17660/g.35682 Transcript_17660/m.35682 type:complete len:106 (-) Transcript_17660:314-631(-)